MKKLFSALFLLALLAAPALSSCSQEAIDDTMYQEDTQTRAEDDPCQLCSPAGKCLACREKDNNRGDQNTALPGDGGKTGPGSDEGSITNPPTTNTCMITAADSNLGTTLDYRNRLVTLTSAYPVASAVEITFTYAYCKTFGQQVVESRDITEKKVFGIGTQTISQQVYEYYNFIPASGTPPGRNPGSGDYSMYVDEQITYKRLKSIKITSSSTDGTYSYSLNVSGIQMPGI